MFIDENIIEEIVNINEYKVIEEVLHNENVGKLFDLIGDDIRESDEDEEVKEELEYQMNDPIKKYQFNYDKSVCLTEN